MRKRIVFILATAVGVCSVMAQNNTSSPYTRYGYGELSDPNFGYTRSMGGLSAGIRNFNHINPGNPASLTAIDTMGFRFEAGASARRSSFSDQNSTQVSWDENLDYLALQFPVTRYMGFSAGLMPYSFVGYEFGNTQNQPSTLRADSLSSTNSYVGKGNITRLYFGLGGNPVAGLHLGVNAYFNFGSLDHGSEVTFADGRMHSTTQTTHIRVHDWSVGFGAQYDFNLDDYRHLVVGATLDLASDIGANASCDIVTAGVDTVHYDYSNSFSLPLSFGTGFAFDVTRSLTVGAQYDYQRWSKAKFYGEESLQDRNRYAAGAEWVPDRQSKKFLKRVSYRAGINSSDSYFTVNGKDINQTAITAGIGLPLKRTAHPSVLSLGFEYGRKGKKTDELILEQYFKFSLNLSINESWFAKRKFE